MRQTRIVASGRSSRVYGVAARVRSISLRSTAATILGLGLGLGSCEKPVGEQAPSPRPVVAIELAWTDPGVALELTGVVEPWNVEDIAFEVGGRLDYVVEAGTLLQGRWNEGDEVITEGDVLAELDPVPFQTALRVTDAEVASARVRHERVLPAQLKASKAMLVQQEQEFARMQEAGDAVSGLDVVRARAALDSAHASVEQVEAEIESAAATVAKEQASYEQRELDLRNARLFAPFDGEVSETYVRAGGIVTAGQPVARLVTMNPVLVELAVSAQTSRLLRIDDSAQLAVAGRRIEQRGKIYQKSTIADPSTRTFSVKVIARNLRLPADEPADPAVLDLPRVKTILPVIRLDPRDRGPLFAEKRAVGEDENGAFVWRAEGLVAGSNLSSDDPSFTVRKVYVTLGERRVNFQKVFVFYELADPGSLSYFDMTAMGVPADTADGGRVALIHETWQLNPGDLVTVRVGRDQGPPGYYVPMEAIALDPDDRTFVFAVEDGPDGALARRVPVDVHNAVGTEQRIVSEALQEGMQIVLRGATYLQDGERVGVTR